MDLITPFIINNECIKLTSLQITNSKMKGEKNEKQLKRIQLSKSLDYYYGNMTEGTITMNYVKDNSKSLSQRYSFAMTFF